MVVMAVHLFQESSEKNGRLLLNQWSLLASEQNKSKDDKSEQCREVLAKC